MSNVFIFLLIIVGAYSGYKQRLLTASGGIAAAFVGSAVALGLGWRGFIVLGTFFFTSSFWSKYKRTKKKKAEQKHEKGSQRDWLQVVANGGIAALASLIFYFEQDPLWLLAFAVAISSANSDTWASEIGTLSKQRPFFLRTFKRSEKGTSGAVSLLGTNASLAGALLIAAIVYLLFPISFNQFLFIFVFGFLGNVFDTLLGAYGQVAYICPICQTETEKKVHCSHPTEKIRGITILNNDAVNMLSGLLAVITGLIFYHYYM
ncbi:DUF92 domain-containing protein [Bacillus marasmi]|uniref:DUF92 domain-containing protein n=1 Tax=Bacillus marasmi TaxID=1926279 RepID=UPI0011C9192B|nr:DUF92 domain-containing protein [Bacillus marasmi]